MFRVSVRWKEALFSHYLLFFFLTANSFQNKRKGTCHKTRGNARQRTSARENIYFCSYIVTLPSLVASFFWWLDLHCQTVCALGKVAKCSMHRTVPSVFQKKKKNSSSDLKGVQKKGEFWHSWTVFWTQFSWTVFVIFGYLWTLEVFKILMNTWSVFVYFVYFWTLNCKEFLWTGEQFVSVLNGWSLQFEHFNCSEHRSYHGWSVKQWT